VINPIYNSPIGPIRVSATEEGITSVSFSVDEELSVKAELSVISPGLIENCISQLHEYFTGARKDFDIPLDPKGTPFMGRTAENSAW
jgi:methylated-DNA-[protein]-cysteine S-methyltransferase